MNPNDEAKKLAHEIIPQCQEVVDAMGVLFHGCDMLAVGYALLTMHARWISEHCAKTGRDPEELLKGTFKTMRRQIMKAK
jgi:hypothetical protein